MVFHSFSRVLFLIKSVRYSTSAGTIKNFEQFSNEIAFDKTSIKSKTEWLVPKSPVKSKIDNSKLPEPTKIDAKTIILLEKLSLVNCANKEGINTLESAIAFADKIQQIDTEGVTPLVTVLEDISLRVHDDEVTDGDCRADILRNAAVVEEEYFLAPPGNIAIEPRENPLHDERLPYNNVLELCEKRGFFKWSGNNLRIGPVAALLLKNLKHEWFYDMTVRSDTCMFVNVSSFNDTFEYVKELCSHRLPFDFSTHMNLYKNVLRTTMFVTPSDSVEFFHQWQRERRTWWRTFSASPGRYSLSDIKNCEGSNQSVNIIAEYPWGKYLIETLKLHTATHESLNPQSLQFKNPSQLINGHYVVSNVNLATLLVNTLCDAFEESQFQGMPRLLFRFHRKIAPYKISFAVKKSEKMTEMSELAVYVCKQLRTKHVSCLLLPSALEDSLEEQYYQYDELGVPYTIVLNESTLKDGLAHLRSRDTTLLEQVHIVDLPAYVENIFKNY